MNAPRRIRTVVVSVPVDQDWLAGESETSTAEFDLPAHFSRPRFRPSDLVPWSDPYIAGLVRKLQDEVRNEAEMPWNEPFEYESDDEPSFTIDETALLG